MPANAQMMLQPSTLSKKGLRDYKLVLDGVTPQTIAAKGDFFHIQAVTNAADIYLSFDDGPAITRQQGEGNRVYYERVTINASVACALTIQLGYGYATDARASVTANVTANATPAGHNPAIAQVAVGAGAQALLLAANAAGLGGVFKIPATSANGLWVGDINAANGVGYYMEPGEGLPIYTTAAVYGFNAGAGPIDCTIMTLTQ